MAEALIFKEAAGQTLTLEIRTGVNTVVTAAISVGSGDGATWYYVENATVLAAGLAIGGLYPFVVLNAASEVIREGWMRWNGVAAIDAEGVIYAALPVGGDQMVGEDQISGVILTTQPRVNRAPGPGFTFQVSRRADGTHKCTRPLRLQPGPIDNLAVGIDLSPLFGKDNFVRDVAAPTVSGGLISATELGPRDTLAMVELGGTATASEEQTLTTRVTMDTGEQVDVTLDIIVFAE
jgi:hypothetical protein